MRLSAAGCGWRALTPRDGESAPDLADCNRSGSLAAGDVFGDWPDGVSTARTSPPRRTRRAIGVVVAGATCSRGPAAVLQVDDGQQALTRLAAWHRGCFGGTVVAVTGSVGKTTARQMIYAGLRPRRRAALPAIKT